MLQSSTYNACHEIRIQPTVATFIFVFASVYIYRYSMSFIVKFFKKKKKESPPESVMEVQRNGHRMGPVRLWKCFREVEMLGLSQEIANSPVCGVQAGIVN